MGPMDENKLDMSLFRNHFPIIWVIPKKDPLIEAKNVIKNCKLKPHMFGFTFKNFLRILLN
jgi:hypothetical protein